MTKSAIEPEFLTTQQASELTGLSVSWFEQQRLAGTDQPPYLRIGRAIRYDRKPLLKWCRDRKVTPGQGA